MRVRCLLSGHGIVAVVVGVVLALAWAGCAPRKAPVDLMQAWRVTDVQRARTTKGGFGPGPADTAAIVTAESFFRFYPEGSATAVLEGRFLVGTWTRDEATGEIVLEADGHRPRRFLVTRAGQAGCHFSEVPKGTGKVFVVEADTFDYRDRDIYSVELNRWRLPAVEQLSDQELQVRMRSMLRYLSAYFESAYVKDVKRLHPDALPTPFRFAGNGIALQHESSFPERWRALYASPQDAVRAAEVIAPLFDDVVMPATANRFERNALIFAQMESALAQTMDAE